MGDSPSDPETPIEPTATQAAEGVAVVQTRGELVDWWKGLSDRLHQIAQAENTLARLKATIETTDSMPQGAIDAAAQAEERLNAVWGPAKQGIYTVRETLEGLKNAPEI